MRLPLFLLFAISQLTAADAARDARWLQDLDSLATLAQLHPNLFFQLPRGTWDQAIASLRNDIPSLTDAEVMVRLAGIAALPGDGHTNLFLTQRDSAFHLLPLQLRWFEDGLFVTAAGPAYTQALAARVTRIGGKSVDDAYRLVAGIISHENDSWARDRSPSYLANADVLRALKIAPDNAAIQFELEDRSGARFSLEVAPLDPGQTAQMTAAPDPATGFTPFYRQQTNRNYWFTYIESSRTLYFAYNVCGNQNGLPFAQFNDQLWAVFDSRPVERFVIDLRNNAGGDSSVLNPFLLSGTARMDRFLAVKPVVLIGRHTFSSAILNAIALHQGPVLLAGEASGGSPNSYGEVKTLVLPNSQLNVSYSTRYFSFPGLPAGALLPDLAVPIYSADWFARHDPFLAAALAGTPPAPALSSSGLAVVNAATFRGGEPVAPGSLASAFADFGGVTGGDAGALPLPRRIDGVEVLVNGIPAPLIAVRPRQINFQVPAAVPAGAADFRVVRNGIELAAGSARIAAAAPGIFATVPSGAVAPGAILQLYATGQGATDPALDDGAAGAALSKLAPRVFFAGELAEVLYSGTQGSYPALWQINVRVPDSGSLSGETPVFVSMGGNPGNAVVVRVN